jgi:hypothetical protein
VLCSTSGQSDRAGGLALGAPSFPHEGWGLAYSGLGAVTLSPIAAATLSGQSGWLPTGSLGAPGCKPELGAFPWDTKPRGQK